MARRSVSGQLRTDADYCSYLTGALYVRDMDAIPATVLRRTSSILRHPRAPQMTRREKVTMRTSMLSFVLLLVATVHGR